MDYRTTKQLLDRYFEGQSTLKEEERLRHYFGADNIHPDFLQYQSLFQFFKAEQVLKTSDRFDEFWENEPSIDAPVAKSRKLWPLFRKLSIAAAMVLGMACLWWMWNSPTTTDNVMTTSIDWSKYEPQTEAEAVSLTRKALLGLSGHLNEGVQQVQQQVKQVKKIADPIH